MSDRAAGQRDRRWAQPAQLDIEWPTVALHARAGVGQPAGPSHRSHSFGGEVGLHGQDKRGILVAAAMSYLSVPPNEIPIKAWLDHLREMAEGDLPAARQAALLRLVWEESYLTRQGLMARVEFLLGRGCFGPSPHAAFQRDMAAVRRVLAEAGHRLVYNRRGGRRGYYVVGRPPLDARLQRLIAGAVAEVDPRQIAISRRLTPAQQFQQGRSMTELAERVAAYRLRQRWPELNAGEARRAVRERRMRG